MGATQLVGQKPSLEGEELFNLIYSQNFRVVRSYVYRFVENGAIADELTQEVFLRAFRALPRFDWRSSPTTWLCVIAKNLCSNNYRDTEKRSEFVSLEEELGDELTYADCIVSQADNVLNLLIAAERQGLQVKVLTEVYQSLSDDRKIIFVDRLLDRMSHKEMSAKYFKSISKIKGDIHRLLAALRSDIRLQTLKEQLPN